MLRKEDGAEDDPSALIELMSTNAPCYHCWATCKAAADSEAESEPAAQWCWRLHESSVPVYSSATQWHW